MKRLTPMNTVFKVLLEQVTAANTITAINDLSTAILIGLWCGAIRPTEAEELRLICEKKLGIKEQ